MQLFSLLLFFLAGGVLSVGVFLYWRSHEFRRSLERHEKQMRRRMYELAILKELGERIGYSLNVQKIIDIITGSLNQFIDYCAVSYMLLEPEKIIFKVHLEKSVSRKFIDEVRQRMLKSLAALLDKPFAKSQVEETLSGAILVEEVEEPVQSFFNIPLVIGERVVGVLTVAHTAVGLYKEEDMTILYKITKQASDAVTRLQEVVQTEQGKLNAMVESMTEGVVMTDKDYRIMVVNPAARRALKLSEQSAVTIFDLIDALHGTFDIRGRLEESVKLDRVLTVDEVLLADRYFQIFVAPVKSHLGLSRGQILGGVVIFHDLTHEKEVERMREDFISMMVHELRSPLDGIKKMGELMQDRRLRSRAKTSAKYLGMIYDSSSAMLNLVNDLLDVAKLEAGKFAVHPAPTAISAILEERVQFFTPAAQAAGVVVRCAIDPKLPATVPVDALRIEQVLNNLLSNAIKFTRTGGTVAVVAITHQRGRDFKEEASAAGVAWPVPWDSRALTDAPDAVILAVADTGVGISPGNRERLFNKFQQFRATAVSGDAKGTGLGLVIVKGIIEAHHGHIGVWSEEGVGSVFYCLLPAPTAGASTVLPIRETQAIAAQV